MTNDVPDYLITRDTAQKSGRRAMDDIEAEGKVYKRVSIDVERPDGSVVTALVYRVIAPQTGFKTNLKYVGYIVKGLRDHGVDEAYIADVKQTAAKNDPSIASDISQL